MSLFPSEAEGLALEDVDAVRRWYGLADEPWEAFHSITGRPDMRILSALPPEAVVENTMRAALPGNASLNPAQAVQVGLVWRLCRRISWTRGGGNWSEWIDEDPWVSRPSAAAAALLLPRGGLLLLQPTASRSEA